MTERYAVIGRPIAHSLSPAMQGAALAAAGRAATYEAIDVSPASLADWVRSDAHTLDGFNVTIPHKQVIVGLLADVDPEVGATGAVNTVVRVGDALIGHNTDVEGFETALSAAGPIRGDEALVFGAGGAARAVVLVLRRAGFRVRVAARTPARARGYLGLEDVLGARDARLPTLVAGADLLVNATPLGMAEFAAGSPLPDGSRLKPSAVAVDLVYGRSTRFLATARESGCRTFDGLEMLVRQGAAAFRLWTGVEPDIAVMRDACLSRLEENACSAS